MYEYAQKHLKIKFERSCGLVTTVGFPINIEEISREISGSDAREEKELERKLVSENFIKKRLVCIDSE